MMASTFKRPEAIIRPECRKIVASDPNGGEIRG
jgi:hypothetical protein